MRITILLPPDDLSGRIRVFATYAERLGKRGHEVTVVQPRHRRPGASRVLESLLQGRGGRGRRTAGRRILMMYT